jgi:hypothetical protein
MWGSGEVAMRRVVAQRKRDRDRRAHLVSQDEVVYAGDRPAISDEYNCSERSIVG